MRWFEHRDEQLALDAEDLAYPPSGGLFKLVILGCLVPLAIGYFAVDGWIEREAVWFGSRRSRVRLTGLAAQAMSVSYFSMAVFCHFRWCWGLLGHYAIWKAGSVLALLGFLGGLGVAFHQVWVH